MNELYNMSLLIHEAGIFLLVLIFVGSLVQLNRADDLMVYLRKMRIQSSMIMMVVFTPVFTGIVMMVAKHLDFTVPNIVMILLSIVLIYFERRRIKPLKFAAIAEEGAFERYKKEATQVLVAEIALIVMISIWMYL